MAISSIRKRLSLLYPLSLAVLVGVVGGTVIIDNNLSTGSQLRTYRIAIAATGEFTQHHGGKAPALAEIKQIVAELNKVYEPEAAIRFQLVSDALQNKIIYTNPATDPFSGDRNAQSDQNQAVIDGQVGVANYDIGHVVGQVASDAGGIAALGVVGKDGRKAQGISETQKPSASDQGFMGVLLHEIGHQFGAEHTFNANALGSCRNNREATNAYEPASGTTLMSYAGICGANDLQPLEDFYFHAASLEQINSYIQNNAHAAPFNSTATANAVPTVDGGLDYVIPARTPFELTADGSDADNDTLTYVWEQIDLGPPMSLPLTDNGSSPLFRSFPPSTNPVRTFPRLSDLLVNTVPPGEHLPTTNRPLNFRVTVRDNHTNGGGVDSDDVLLTVRDTGVPFALTGPNGGQSFVGGADRSVTWNVAGTNANGINASQVNIFLSTNGGESFPFLLATTANDGSAPVRMPNINTTRARLKIQGADNIFFDISDANFSLTSNPALPGITLIQSNLSTTVTEDGVFDSYQLKLNSDPAGTLTVTATADAQTEVSIDGVTFYSSVALQFNSATSRTVVVRAVDDALAEGGHTGIVTHAVTSSTSTSYPKNMVVNQVDARVIDNESPPVVGVDLDFSDTHPSPDNWATLVMNTAARSLNDLRRDDGVPTPFDLTLKYDSGGSIGWNSAPVQDVTKPQHHPPLGAISGFNHGERPLTATWADLVPGRTYGVYVFGLDGSDAGDYSQTVTITGATTLPTFAQGLTPDDIFVNHLKGSHTRNLTYYEKRVAADSKGFISIRIEPTPGADGVGVAALALREIVSTDPGLTITSTTVEEGGAAGTYQFNLNSAPGGALSVLVEADAQTEISLDGTTFSSSQTVMVNNTVPQVITVRAIDDTYIEGNHVSTITHTILSSSSTTYPLTLGLPAASIQVIDDEVLGPLAGIDYETGAGTTPTNWRALGAFFNSGQNLKWEDGTNSTIDLSASTTSSAASGPSQSDPEFVPMHTPSLSGLDTVLLHGNTGPLRYTWADLTPGKGYNLYVFGLEGFGGDIVLNQTVTITGAGAPFAFTQATTANRELWVNGQRGSSDKPIESFAVQATATAEGKIEMSLVANNGVPWICMAGLAIQEAPVVPGVSVDVGNGLTLTEGGATDTYLIQLDSVPAGAVQITVTADGQGQVSVDGASFAGSQSFTLSDTSPKTITVRAFNDVTVENPHITRISHQITLTADPANYPMSTVIRSVTGVITDNDVASLGSVSIAATDPNGAEPSDDAAFTVSLSNGQLAPAGGILVDFDVSGSATEGSDYAPLGNMVHIPAGSNAAVIVIDVTNDSAKEMPEEVIITLTGTDHAGVQVAAAPANTARATLLSDEQTAQQAFLSAFFDVDILLDPAKEATHWGALADLDRDGVSTLEEFFHNLSPSIPDEGPVGAEVVVDEGVSYLEMVFRRRKDHGGVQQLIEQGASPAANSWQPLTNGVELVTSLDAETEEVRVRFEITPDLQRRFLRLKLTEN